MRERPLTTFAVTGSADMKNKYEKLLPLRILNIVLAAIIIFFTIKNGSAFETDAKNAFAMFFTESAPVTSFISYRLMNALLLIAMGTVIVFNVLSHLMCMNNTGKLKNNSAGLILEISADFIGSFSGAWYFITLPFACKAGVDSEAIGFIGFLAVCVYWLLCAVFKTINYKSMRKKYYTVNKIYEGPARIVATAIIAVVLILGVVSLVKGNSVSSFGIYGKEERELNVDFYSQISNNFNSAVSVNDKVYFYDRDINDAFCVIDGNGEIEVISSDYKMIESSPMCLDGNNILFLAANEEDSSEHILVKYDVSTGSISETRFHDTPELTMFKTFLGVKNGMVYYITYSASSNGWYDVRRVAISDNMDLAAGELYAPHVVYSSELYPAMIGNSGKYSLSVVTAPYSTSQPTVNINGENIYYIDRTPYKDQEEGEPERADLTISDADGSNQIVLHTFEDISIVRIFVADTYIVYEYTPVGEEDAFAYGVVPIEDVAPAAE